MTNRLAGTGLITEAQFASLSANTASSTGEIAYAANASGVAESIASGVTVSPAACVITVPVTNQPLWICGAATMLQTGVAAGPGSLSVTLIDWTHQSFLETEFYALPNVQGRLFSVSVAARLPMLASATTYQLALGLNADSAATATHAIQNAAQTPSRIWAVAS